MGGFDSHVPVHHIRTLFSSLSLRKHRNSKDSVQRPSKVQQNNLASLSCSTLVSNTSIVDVKVDYLKHPCFFSPSDKFGNSECGQFCEFTYEGEYYHDFKGPEDQLCIVQVQNSLFKVCLVRIYADERLNC
jgi:hypothetical protein